MAGGPPGRPARPRPASVRGRSQAARPRTGTAEPEAGAEAAPVAPETGAQRPARREPPTAGRAATGDPVTWVAGTEGTAGAPGASTGRPPRPPAPPSPVTRDVPRQRDDTRTVPLDVSGVGGTPPSAAVPVVGDPRTAPVPAPFAGPRRAPVVTTGVADRLAERESMRRHRRRRRVVWSVAGALCAAGVAWVVFFSPVLATDPDEVRVVGAGELVDVSAVRGVVAGVDGVPLPRLDTVALRSRLLAVRGVGDVSIAREWPHGLQVRITPREPVAAVPDDGRLALLDAQGGQIAVVSDAPKGVPVVNVPLGAKDHRALDAVLVVLAGLPESVSKDVTAVSAQTQDAVELTLRKGVTVVWGGDEDTALKAKVLEALRTAPQTKGASVFDVSAPTLPVTR